MSKLKFCLDTNIIKDYLDDRNKESTHLLKLIRNNNIEVVSSVYALMELSDQKKDYLFLRKKLVREKEDLTEFISERRSKELSLKELQENIDYIQRVFNELKFISWITLLDNRVWKMMLDYSRSSNIDAPDVVHLVTAYITKSTHLITRDGNFMKHANIFLEERSKSEKEEIKLRLVNVEQAIKVFFP